MPRAFLTSSATTVLESAALISKIISDSSGHTLTVPFAGYCAYASATVHVWGVFSKNPGLEQASKEGLRHNYRYLTRMKRYWGMFHYMAESVKDNYRAFADAAMKFSGAALLRRSGSGGDGTPTPMDTTNPPSRADTPGGGGPDAKASGTSGRTMFQYGDWFDKYPHGVSESEWERSHLEYRREAAHGGAEAVMSQRSDLQSVEEFFASLSPPSKADEPRRGKKIARKRGKSIAENKKTDSHVASTSNAGQSTAAIQPPPPPSRSAGPGPAGLPTTAAPADLDVNVHRPFNPSDFDITSPSLYQTPPFPSLPAEGFGDPNSPNINFHWINTLPAIDRQMVFGAYSGVDPSNTHPNTHLGTSSFVNDDATQMDNFGNTNPWEHVDVNSFGFDDSLAGGTGMVDTSSSAWLLPFNIDPPDYGGVEEMGNTALDGMDFHDFPGGGGGAVGSDLGGQFPEPESGGG
jgi:hypothetical protein